MHRTSHFSLLTSHFFSGLLLGLALTIRTHEALWVAALVAVIVWFQTKDRIGNGRWSAIGYRLSAIGFGLILPFIPILVLNVQIYGSMFTTGYALLQENGSAPTEFVASVLPGWLAALVAPFGWHPVEALARFWKYTIVPYPWFSGFVAVGFAVALARSAVPKFKVQSSKFKTNSNDKFSKLESRNSIWALDLGFWTSVKMTVGSIILMVWLILYYGSWELADSLVRETNVLTISYARYWLPVTIALAPWAALGFRWVLDRCAARWRPVIAAFVFLGIASTSFTQVVTDTTEGLLRQRAALAEHRARARAVIAATEPDAVIVSHRMDKVFFPERAVVHVPEDPVTDLDVLRRLRVIADVAPTYWYTASRPSLSGFTFIANDDMPFGEQLYRVRAL